VVLGCSFSQSCDARSSPKKSGVSFPRS
jgi:hypothetical protein